MIGLGTHPKSVVGVAKDYYIEQLLASLTTLIEFCQWSIIQVSYQLKSLKNLFASNHGRVVNLGPTAPDSGPAEGRGVEETPLFSPPALGAKAVLSAEEIRFDPCIGYMWS
jgi:hypothetical protein